MVSTQTVTVTRTYLHLPERSLFRPSFLHDPDVLVMEAREVMPEFYLFLYSTVGRHHYWRDRLRWSHEELREYLSEPSVTLVVLYLRGTPGGYIELNAAHKDEGVEIPYFGIMPPFQGRGLGKHLLSCGVQRAFEEGAQRVWLDTCTLDGPYALANYQARGFRPYRTETYQQVLSPTDER